MTAGTLGWLRNRSPTELTALAAGVLVLGWLGWDPPLWDARQQAVLHLVALGTIAGVALAAVRGAAMPRTPLDLPILVLLAAFAAATASAANHGVSLRAMAAIVAMAAMLPVALLAIRHRPSWVGVITAVPVLLLAVPTLAVLLLRRIEWIVAGAPGLPPLRLLNEGTPFGSVAVPPFVIWPAWALAGLIEEPRWRRRIRAGLVIVGVPLTVLSGSRSAWLAIAVAALATVVPWAWVRRDRLRPPRGLSLKSVLILVAGLAALVIGFLVVLPRLTAVASLLYRASLWRDTLAAWASDPLLGIGPGFMPIARQAAAPDFSFPVRQPHSHNLPLGVLGDAGLVGLGAGLLVVVSIALVASPWRARTPTGRAAAIVLLGMGVGGLFEDLTFLPGFSLLAIALVALVLADAGAVTWVRPALWATRRRMSIGAGGALAALALLPAVILGDAGAIAHRTGLDAWIADRPAEAQAHFATAADLDPWHAAPPKALAVAAAAAGDTARARRAAERAVALNPGDAASWANLAILCELDGDDGCATDAASGTVATASFLGLELANAALVLDALGETAAADDAYRRSLLSQRLTGLALDWPRTVPVGDRMPAEDTGALAELNRVLAWWAEDEPIRADSVADPASRALAHAMRNEREEAEPLLVQAIATAPEDPLTWQIAIVLRDHWGSPIDDELRVWRALTGVPFPARDARPSVPASTDDIASFRGYPADELVPSAERLETDPIWPWALSRTLP